MLLTTTTDYFLFLFLLLQSIYIYSKVFLALFALFFNDSQRWRASLNFKRNQYDVTWKRRKRDKVESSHLLDRIGGLSVDEIFYFTIHWVVVASFCKSKKWDACFHAIVLDTMPVCKRSGKTRERRKTKNSKRINVSRQKHDSIGCCISR